MLKRYNVDGYSLVEVLVALAIAGIVMAAALSLVQPMIALKRQMSTTSGLYNVTMYIRDCVNNDNAWVNTIALNSPTLDCVSAAAATSNPPAQCQVPSPPTPIPISLFTQNNSPPVPCIADYDTSENAPGGLGLTEEGVPCSGYVPFPNGNLQCRYRFNVAWLPICPGGPSVTRCANPIVKVTGTMVDSVKLDPSHPTPALVGQMPMKLHKYDISILRGRADQNRYFTLSETSAMGVPPGSGICNTTLPNGQPRYINHVVKDPGGYAVVDPNPTGIINLQAGSYDCQISVPGYGVGGFKSALIDLDHGNNRLLMGTSEFSPYIWSNVQTRSEMSGTFTLTANTNVQVVQFCLGSPSDVPSWSMGVPSGIGGPFEVYTTMSCRVLAVGSQ